ncbi:hypothetical protein ES708_26725 [subsurface metagenome]
MEPISAILAAAAGYILKGAAQSKAAGKVKEELLGNFWLWVHPYFIKDITEAETTPEAPATEEKVQDKLIALVENEEFFNELVKRVTALQQSGIIEKNIVKGSIKRVKRIRIGDKFYNPNESYNRKNIVEGSVEDADDFILGDGH